MKKLILIAALIIVAGTIYGQNFKKGHFVGSHVMTITLNPKGGMNDLGNAANAKLQPLTDELAKLGTYTSKYTDWVIQ